jgi:hypothetical protein
MTMPFIIGVRISKESGLLFFGLDELNTLLKEGKRVTIFEPGDALFQRITEDEENARIAFSGFTIKVSIED